MNKILAIVCGCFVCLSVFANVDCTPQFADRCLCPAGMNVLCKSGAQGFVDDLAPVYAITVKYTDPQGQEKTVTLQNPKGTARDFYAAEANKWLKTQLPLGSTGLSVTTMTFDDETPLYTDSGGIDVNGDAVLAGAVQTVSGKIPKKGSNNQFSENRASCNYLSNPDTRNFILVRNSRCSTDPMKVCFSEVSCVKDFKVNGIPQKPGRYNVYCKADQLTGLCPADPVDCMNDSSIDSWGKEGFEFMEIKGTGPVKVISQ